MGKDGGDGAGWRVSLKVSKGEWKVSDGEWKVRERGSRR